MRQAFDRWTKYYQQSLAPDSLPKSWQITLLSLILLGVFVIRIVTIRTPALEETAWKEIDYLMISQNYWQNGFNFFQPEVSWPAEPPRVTEMEFPLVPYTTAILYELLGYNVYTARLITLFSFLLLTFYVFRLAQRELGPFVGVTAAFVAGSLPLFHPFGRLLFTEPLMIAMSVISLYYLAEWVDGKKILNGVLAWLALSLTLALKIETLYLFLPILWIAFRKYRLDLKPYKNFLILILLALVLPIIWYIYAYYLETTGAHLFGIFTGHNKSQTIRMLTTLGWYRTMAGRIINQILGGFVGTIMVLCGLLSAFRLRRGGLFIMYLMAVGAYFALVAEGQIDAPYRQLTSIPALSVFVAMGAIAIVLMVVVLLHSLRGVTSFSNRQKQAFLIVCLLFLVLIPFRKLKQITVAYGPAHWDRWSFAQTIKGFTDHESKLVVHGEYSIHVGGYDMSPVLYHYSGLQGWTLTAENLTLQQVERLRQKGATHFVALPYYGDSNSYIYLSEADTTPILQELQAFYPVIFKEGDILILDLTHSNQQ